MPRRRRRTRKMFIAMTIRILPAICWGCVVFRTVRQPLPGLDVLIGTGWGEFDESGGKQGTNFVPGLRYIADEDLKQVDVRNGGRYRVVQRTAGVDGQESLAARPAEAAANGWRLFGFLARRAKIAICRIARRTAILIRRSGANLRRSNTLPPICTKIHGWRIW